ncbi:MAG: VWA domain-containing protein [Bacteroidales bacterium]|nr:VWA domain-containing protein [Bacteroidales bacterium]
MKVFTYTTLLIGILILFTMCQTGADKSSPEQLAIERLVFDEEEALVGDISSEDFNTEEYERIYENPFMLAAQNPLSTFSIDVDNASYSNIRRFLENNQLPPKDAVRIEEMINYFDYNYPQPDGEHPFSLYTEVSESPWNDSTKLIHIGIQGKKLNDKEIKPNNLVFLIDVSGSMNDRNKLPLVKRSLKMLTNELDDKDHVAIVVYAGAAGLVLPSTPASDKFKIIEAIDQLSAGGSTAGGEGIELAYKIAKENLIDGGNNRVILSTDGDFNVGISSNGDLIRLIEEKRKDDIYLTICGFGMGNYKDSKMEQISNAGNGNYFYIDNVKEAEKVFVNDLRANMYTIAKDVKIQVEFNPVNVKAYRLIGYENRVLKNEDFNDDQKDAGELGAGHTVTAIYEIVPASSGMTIPGHDDLKYQDTKLTNNAESKEIVTLKLRYKPIGSEESKLITSVVQDSESSLKKSSDLYRFSAAVAGFGMLLRDSEYKGDLDFEKVLSLAKSVKMDDPEGYIHEFIELVETAELLSDEELTSQSTEE